ncbi:polyketide synthase [Bacillus velezensis]|nr:polyketide synthase [Bacillus velezensis]
MFPVRSRSRIVKTIEKAIEDQDQIYGVIKGSAVNHGGKTSGYSIPNPDAQAEVISEALRKADIDPNTVNYIEAHGTGTSLGDPIEIQGLKDSYQLNHPCAIGSVKSNIGHLESAAGIAR